MRIYILGVIWIVTFIVSGCENASVSDVFRPQVSVVGLLAMHEQQQVINVFYSSPEERAAVEWDEYFAVDARVVITCNAETLLFQLVYRDDHPTFVNTQPFTVMPGSTYQLQVLTAHGNVRGTTTVPDVFAITAPHRNDSLPADQAIRIAWTASAGATAYQVHLIGPLIDLEISPGLFIPVVVSENYATLETHIDVPFFEIKYPGAYTATVFAVDSNFSNFKFAGIQRSGVQNAYGMFASAGADTVRFIVVDSD